MILAGSMNCLRGFPGLKKEDYLFVYHNGENFIFEVITMSQLKPTFIIPKKKIVSIDMLFPDNLERMCGKMINDTISGEILFGSAHLFMDGIWYNGKSKKSAVKRILCIAYSGEIDGSIETIYLTERKPYCEKMYKKLQEAWKAPPEYYRNYPGGRPLELPYQYMWRKLNE